MKKIKLLSVLFLLLIVGVSFAQTKITGVITDAKDGTPIPFVSVVVKQQTNIGVSTDINGKFEISVPQDGKTLIASFVGYATQEVEIAGQTTINIQLRSEDIQLSEVMVIAYGTTSKKSFTGSATQIDSKVLELQPITNITNALVGVSTGVQTTTANGQPGSEATIRIRGIGSLNASNAPLIVLDGLPYADAMSSINPTDIESLTILKDASSTALYGSRAANGVVMITTKKGKKEKMVMNFKASSGFTSREISDYNKVGIDDYLSLYWENLKNKYVDGGVLPDVAATQASNNLFSQLTYNPYNLPSNQVVGADGKVNPNGKLLWKDDLNWLNAIQQLGTRNDYSLSISGGSEKTSYYASAGYTQEKGFIVGSEFSRISARGNVNSQITKWFKTSVNIGANLSASDGNQDESSGSFSNPFMFTRYIGPIYPIYIHNPVTGEYILDPEGKKQFDFGGGYDFNGVIIPKRDYGSGTNPAIELQNRVDRFKRNLINMKGMGEVTFLKDFKFTVNTGVSANAYLGATSSPVYDDKGNTGSASRTNTFTTTWTINQLLTWNRTLGKHHFDALVGHESYQYKYNNLSASLKDQIFNGNDELANYLTLSAQPSSYTSSYNTEGFLSRVNYDFDGKYLASASFRRDGSSRFYKDSRWGNFWSIGGAWRIDKENFMESVKFVNMLKFRASYGEVGNDDLSSYYPWQALYTRSQNATEAGYIQSTLGSKSLMWEVGKNLDFALEYTILNRIRGTFEVFKRESSNLLFSVPLSPTTGMTDQDMNAGSMYNQGIEFQIAGDIISTKDWKWTLDLNATSITNKVTELPVAPFISTMFKVEEGHSRYEFFLYQWKGIDPATGASLYKPMEGATTLVTIDGVDYTTSLNQAVKEYSGSSMPKVYGGITNTVSFKQFTFSFLFTYQLGGKMYDISYYQLMAPNKNPNSAMHADVLNRWQNPGDITNVPRLSDGANATDLRGAASTRWLISSNMFELSSLNLSYEVPSKYTKKMGVNGLSVYASANNVFMLSKRQGMNARYSTSGYTSSDDNFSPTRVVSFGINFNLQ